MIYLHSHKGPLNMKLDLRDLALLGDETVSLTLPKSKSKKLNKKTRHDVLIIATN